MSVLEHDRRQVRTFEREVPNPDISYDRRGDLVARTKHGALPESAMSRIQ